MKKIQIEGWALRVVEQINSGQPNEDFTVELKREWPDAKKAARRIAGHANAAQGDFILWLIGVDETDGVVGANHLDVASWYAEVKTQFDGLAPALIDLNVPVEDQVITSLVFETDRAPFVVKNPMYGTSGGGAVQLEVPWREGTSIRSATRSDLIKLLSSKEDQKARLIAKFVREPGLKSPRNLLRIENQGSSEARDVRVILNDKPLLEHGRVLTNQQEEIQLIGPKSHIDYLMALDFGFSPPFKVSLTWIDDSGEQGSYRTIVT